MMAGVRQSLSTVHCNLRALLAPTPFPAGHTDFETHGEKSAAITRRN